MRSEEAMELRAQQLAVHAHFGQVDMAGHDYYKAHVADVARRVGDDPVLRTIAYLDDIVEDTSVSPADLQLMHFPAEVVNAVDALTHRPFEARIEYYDRVRVNPLALQVKLADIASNTDPARMHQLDEPTRARLHRKYSAALDLLF